MGHEKRVGGISSGEFSNGAFENVTNNNREVSLE